jgi:hypothetical protein
VAHDGPWPCVLASAHTCTWQHRGGTVAGCHLVRRCHHRSNRSTYASNLSFHRSSRRRTPQLYSHVLSIAIPHRHHHAPCFPISSCRCAAPWCRTLPLTTATPPRLKLPGLPLTHHGAIPERPYP